MPASEEEVPEDASEAQEAEGVAEIEMQAPELSAEEAETQNRQTLEEFDDRERAELEEAATDLGAAAGPEERARSMRLSKSFVLEEFHCCRGHCTAEHVPGNAVPALRRLVTEVLQPMRDRFGRCALSSGYRNALHNGHVSGKPDSRHRYDKYPGQVAADVSFAQGNVDEWAAEARRRLRNMGNIGGIGRYYSSRFVHVDLGPERRWQG
jgi:uncharacterized protein YcbK (DUF882 family)